MKLRFLLIAILCLYCSAAMRAQELSYGPYDGRAPLAAWGTTFGTTYHVALHLTDSRLVGKQIRGVVVPLDSTAGHVTQLTAWVADTLKSDNSRQLTNVSGQPSEGFDTLRFAEPFTIPETGIFVGYSLQTNDKKLQPIMTIADDPAPDTYYMMSAPTYRRWKDRHASSLGTTAMQVLISGFSNYAVTVTDGEDVNAGANEPAKACYVIRNYGTSRVSGVHYSWTVNDKQGDAAAKVNLRNHFGYADTIQVEVPALPTGNFPMKVHVDQVNNQTNLYTDSAGERLVVVYDTLPVHRPVLEEYTGTWCGYCPRGWVGLNHMNQLYPDDFIAISYHNHDPMAFTNEYPIDAPGYPAATLDRGLAVDAYRGLSKESRFHLDDVWNQIRQIFSPVNVKVNAHFTDDHHILATAGVKYGKPSSNNPYALSFVLTADSLLGNRALDSLYATINTPKGYGNWQQHSYYSDDERDWPDSDMLRFTRGAADQYLVFNDVAVAWSGKQYVEGSLPLQVQPSVEYTGTYAFDISTVTSVYYDSIARKYVSTGLPVIQHKTLLNVIALVIDKQSGTIINAAKCRVAPAANDTGVRNVAVRRNVSSSRRIYSVDGRLLPGMTKGLNIVRDSDGRVYKVLH